MLVNHFHIFGTARRVGAEAQFSDYLAEIPGGPSDDLGRSFEISFSPKFQNPTMLVNYFHLRSFFCFFVCFENIVQH